MLRTAAKRTAVQAAKKKRTSRATGRKDHGPEAWNKLLPHLPQGGRRRGGRALATCQIPCPPILSHVHWPTPLLNANQMSMFAH